MSSRQFSIIFAAIFILGLLPLLLIQSLGTASAGFSAGFMLPVQFPAVLLFLCVGIGANYLEKKSLAMLPLSFLLMLLIGALSQMEAGVLPGSSLILGAGWGLFILAVALGYSRIFLIAVTISASAAYHLGGYYIAAMPEIASALYFLLGIMLSATLMVATGGSVGLALTSELPDIFGKLKKLPAVVSFLSFF